MLDAIRTSTESFWSFLSDIAIVPLLAAIGCHLLKLACTSRAWRNVLAAAYPETPVAWRPILAAYVSGVGINAIVPARAGDAVRIFLAHRAIPGSSYTTIVSSTVVLTFVDMTLALLVFGWALTQGVLPSFDALSALPAVRLLVGLRGRGDPPRGAARDPRRAGGRRLAPAPLLAPAAPPRRAGLQRLRPADALRPHGGRLAAPGLDAAARHRLVLPRRLRHPPERRQRAPRPGDDEPVHARPGDPGRDRHRAGAARLRLPRRRASRAPRCSRSASA